MAVEFHEEVSPIGGARPASTGNALRSRGQIHESITVGSSGISEAVREEPSGGVEQESFSVSKRGGAGLSPTARKMLENIDKHGTVSDDAPKTEIVDEPAAAAAPAPSATPTPAVAPPAAAAPAVEKTVEIADPAAEHKSRADRFQEHNQKLVTELEQLRAKPARGEPSAREKALDEAERTIIDDSIGAVRKVLATALGVDDPKHPDVDKHLTWLYHDLTEQELGVPLDPGIKALRESERVKHLRARDKRDLAAESARPAAQAADPESAAKVPIVARMIEQGDHATRFPLLRLSVDFDGVRPEERLWTEIRRGFQTGEYANPTTPEQDTQLIDLASRKIEAHYQALADKLSKARPQTAASTATPTQAPVATDRKAEPQGTGPRTITNASASVAPATTPAAKPASTETPPKKPWRNEKERIRMLAAKHSGEAS